MLSDPPATVAGRGLQALVWGWTEAAIIVALRPAWSHGPLLCCHSLITVIVTVIDELLLQKLEERTVGEGECAPTKALLS